MLQVPQARDQVVAGGARARQCRARLQPLEVVPPDELERGLQFRPARRADAGLRAQRLAACAQEAAQRPEAPEQAAREVDRIHAARAVAQPDGEQFRLGERARAEGEEFFARPLGRGPVPDVHAASLARASRARLSQIAPVPG